MEARHSTVVSDKEGQSKDPTRTNKRAKKYAGYFMRGAIILVVWGIIAIPTVVFYYPRDKTTPHACLLYDVYYFIHKTEQAGLFSCYPTIYSQDMCRDALERYKECRTGNAPKDDALIRDILDGLLKFMCLVANEGIHNSKEATGHCQELYEHLEEEGLEIPKEKQLLSSLNNCSDSADCLVPFNCNYSVFYLNETTGLCHPKCFSSAWYRSYQKPLIVIRVLVFIALNVFVLFLTVVNRHRMFVFPSVLIVYTLILILISEIIVLLAETIEKEVDNSLCSHFDLGESQLSPTAWCSVYYSGIVFTLMVQGGYMVLFHILTVFWKIKFPFHYKATESAERIKYIHLTVVTVALLLPIVTLVPAAFANGRSYPIIHLPNTGYCSIKDLNGYYGSAILQFSLVMALAMLFLLEVVITIGKGLHTHNKLKRIDGSASAISKVFIYKAELKLIVIFCYFVMTTLISLSSFAVAYGYQPVYETQLYYYFTCQATGQREDCVPVDDKTIISNFHFYIAGVSMFRLYPLVNIPCIINFQKTSFFQAFKKWFNQILCKSDEEKFTNSASN